MTPWLVLTVLVAAINLTALIVIRGRWGRIVAVLLPAALLGTAGGEAAGGAASLEIIKVGDFHLVAACVGAQLAMLVVLLLSNAMPRGADSEEVR